MAGCSALLLPASYSNSFVGTLPSTLSLHSLKGSFIRTKSVLEKKKPLHLIEKTTHLPAGVRISKPPEHHLYAHVLCKACWGITGI